MNENSPYSNSITLVTTQQASGSSTPFEGLPLEKQDLEKANDTKSPSVTVTEVEKAIDTKSPSVTVKDVEKATDTKAPSVNVADVEKAIDTKSPSVLIVEDVTTRMSSSSIALDGPTSSAAAPVDRDTTLTNRFSGVHVRDRLTPGNPESKVYVVGLGNDDADMNPRTWGLSLRIWAT